MEKLPAEFKKKWVDALRSGDYKQARGQLCQSNGSCCCLGVAALIAGISKDVIGSGSFIQEEYTTIEFPKILIGGSVNENIKQLVILNDIQQKSFPEIADWIDANL